MRLIIAAALLALCDAAAIAEPIACLDCHDDAAGGAIHALMETAHGQLPESCEACHGPSLKHKSLPTEVPPDVRPTIQSRTCHFSPNNGKPVPPATRPRNPAYTARSE